MKEQEVTYYKCVYCGEETAVITEGKTILAVDSGQNSDADIDHYECKYCGAEWWE